ncbi:alpha/beta hydrolase family protein [Stutzerimonas nitrititolerans]|uniref:alpha/beta hydrolase family protein n=1 Tax=Stutzerimonas nitrititolerans TaxID=2482751 RepID=UPI002898AF1E|nr:S9 family peptidase [Stutzerimonas nitrititolerans]
MSKTAVPYGFWPNEWSAERAAAASRDFAELRAGHGGLFWIEYDPTDARCTLWYWREGQASCLTPAGFSLRSRVYEYGGGAFCLTAQEAAFVNEADQQIYIQELPDCADDGARSAPYKMPVMLSRQVGCRYGDLQFDRHGNAIVALEERHGGASVEHCLVSFSLDDGERRVLVEGADFYSSPTLDPEGERLAWIEWSRPEQPWTATRLCCAERMVEGRWGNARCLAGADGQESLQQARFAEDGTLYCLSDRAGGWQPWCECAGRFVMHEFGGARSAPYESWPESPVGCAPRTKDFDCAPAPWQLGMTSYQPLAGGGLLLTHMRDGFGLLFEHEVGGGARQLAKDYSRCRQLAVDERFFYCIAGSADRTASVLKIDRHSGETSVLAGGEQPLLDAQLSRPQSLYFPTGQGESAHAYLYLPNNAEYCGMPGERPPLVVFIHGGPTSACYPVFDSRIQFWTQRGFAVVDVNYRGSSGFGRAYRHRLREQWGVLDVEDACQAVHALAAGGQIDPSRMFIRGSSAGGYTALCALVASDLFRGGASLYGVSDPLALRRVTHKFEGDYLDWLIGDPQKNPERYSERTPLRNAGRITAPVIFFQGGQDAVVLPDQTEAMVSALQARSVAVEYRQYPQERHGFRDAQNLADALEREWRFYQRLL